MQEINWQLEWLQAKRNSEKLREEMQQQARAFIGYIMPNFGQLIVDQFGDMTLSSLFTAVSRALPPEAIDQWPHGPIRDTLRLAVMQLTGEGGRSGSTRIKEIESEFILRVNQLIEVNQDNI
jgi:hypothetical protein